MSWGNRRVAALCNAYRITLPELCALVGEFKRARIAAFWKSGKWPCTMTILFDKMEKTIANNGRP
jgi:hypothetical protein